MVPLNNANQTKPQVTYVMSRLQKISALKNGVHYDTEQSLQIGYIMPGAIPLTAHASYMGTLWLRVTSSMSPSRAHYMGDFFPTAVPLLVLCIVLSHC